MKNQNPIQMFDFSTGLIDDKSVSKFLIPDSSVNKSINVVFNKPRGSITQRLGSTLLGSVVSSTNTILGLHNFISSTASYSKLLSVATNVIYSYDGSSWTSTYTGLNSGLDTNFLTYLDRVVFLNGTNQSQSWDGNGAWVATGGPLDISNFPITKYATVLNTRILATGNTSAPDTVYASSLEASNAISWTSGNKSFKVNPNDGAGNITGITGNGRVALIFKQRGLYRYDDTDLQRIGYVGTPSYKSICTDDNGVTYFFGQGSNGVGFYATDGGSPVKISRAIQKYVSGISPSVYSRISVYSDGEKIEWAVGGVTIDGITYSNVSVVYFPNDKMWTVFDRADSFRVFSQYINTSSAITVVGGDTDGAVQTIDSGNTDNGTNIVTEVEFKPYHFSDTSSNKQVNKIFSSCTQFNGLKVSLKTDQNDFIQLGSINDFFYDFPSLPRIRGKEFVFKLTSTNDQEPYQFDGFEFPVNSIIFE